MSPWKKVRTFVLVAIMLAGGLEVGERLGVPGVHGLVAFFKRRGSKIFCAMLWLFLDCAKSQSLGT
jgi:hypothetical protein